MPQFVTSAKIWLTILIGMFCERTFREEDTVKILPFITSHLLPGLASGARSTTATIVALEDIEVLLRDLPINIESSDADLTGPNNAWNTFVFRYCGMVSLDDLDHHFDKLEHDPTGKPSCLFGAFTHRMRMAYQLLRFEDQMQVWHDFAQHRSRLVEQHRDIFKGETLGRYRMKVLLSKMAEADQMRDHSLYELMARRQEESNAGVVGEDELRTMLRFQIEKMEQYGARVDLEVENNLTNLLHVSQTSSSMTMHYYRFLSSWYAGDYYSSLDNLHRYYDYTMPEHDWFRSQYPYACLQMAMLQSDFGCFEESLPAINEAISAAREAKDYKCLAYCLAWLYTLNMQYSTEETRKLTRNMLGSDDAGLTYLRQQAKENRMYKLESTMLLCQAQAAVSKGASPLQAFERIHESSSLILQYDSRAMTAQPPSEFSLRFHDLGLHDIAAPYLDLALSWYGRNMSKRDSVHALCSKAVMHTLAGQTEAADRLLSLAEKEASINFEPSQIASQYRNIIGLKIANNQNDHRAARMLIHSLRGTPYHDPTLRWTVAMLEIDYYTRLRDFTQALNLIEQHFATLKHSPVNVSAPISTRLELLNAKSRVFIKSGRAQKALSLTVRAATAAHKARLFMILWDSIALLMHVLNSVKCQDLAVDLGDLYVEQVRECGMEFLLAQMQDALHAAYSLKLTEPQDDEVKARNMQLLEQWKQGALASYATLKDEHGAAAVMMRDAALHAQLGSSSGKQRQAQQTESDVDAEWDFSRLEGLTIMA